MKQVDAFDGVFDDPARRVREVVQDGRVVLAVQSSAVQSASLTGELGIDQPWGSYPPRPAETRA